MSQGTTPITPPSPTVPATDWTKIIAVVLAAFLGGMHVSPSPAPQPAPHGGQIQPIPPTPLPGPVPPIPYPPSPVPTPVPVPVPTPQAVVTVTDSSGNPINGGVSAGQMFTVTSPAGSSLMGLPQPSQQSADIVTVSDNKLICTLQAGAKLQVIAYGAGKPTVVMITCLTAPQPPPNPNPTPVNPPLPTPQGEARKLSISIIEDAANRPPEVASVLSNFTFWNSLRLAGNDVRIYDRRDTTPQALSALNALKSANVSSAGIVIQDKATGSVLFKDQLPPTNAGAISLVNQYLGSKS